MFIFLLCSLPIYKIEVCLNLNYILFEGRELYRKKNFVLLKAYLGINHCTNYCTSEGWEMVSHCGFYLFDSETELESQPQLRLSWLETWNSALKKKKISWDHDIWSHHFMANRRGKVETLTDFIFLGSKITVNGDCSHEIKYLFLGRKAMTNLDSIYKSRPLPQKVHVVNATVFPPAMMWELNHKEGWALKNWFWTVLL